MSYGSVPDHRPMVFDRTRNDAYAAALRQVITPDSVVLDLGAGTGILGLMAARLGARRVYLVEPTDIVAIAQEIVDANRLQDVVTCVKGRIEDVELPERVDVILSVLTGNFLLTEDLLQTLFVARDKTLKPGGRLLPSHAAMDAVPMAAPPVHAREISAWSSAPLGVDLSPARAYSANSIFFRVDGLRDAVFLAEPVEIAMFDFTHHVDAGVNVEASYDITQAGVCDGFMGWFRIKLGDHWLSTSPRAQPVHWSPAYLPLDPPIAFERGERVSFSLSRPSFSEWTWSVRSSSASQRHSTMLSAPMTADTLRKASPTYTPALNLEGRILADVLAMCAGSKSVEAIATELCARYPDQYGKRAEAMKVVRGIIRRYA